MKKNDKFWFCWPFTKNTKLNGKPFPQGSCVAPGEHFYFHCDFSPDADGDQTSDCDESSLGGSETAGIPPGHDPIQGA